MESEYCARKPSYLKDDRIAKSGSRGGSLISACCSASTEIISKFASAKSAEEEDDSDCMIMEDHPLSTASSSTAKKTSFTGLCGSVRRRMIDKLSKRSSDENPHSSSVATMRVMLESIVVKREYLLGLAKRVDESIVMTGREFISDMLSRVIPVSVVAKTSKTNIVEHMVRMWDILQFFSQ